MGDLNTVLSGVQQAAQSAPPLVEPPDPTAQSSAPPETSAFRNVLSGVADTASPKPMTQPEQPSPFSEDDLMRSVKQKRAAMQETHDTLLDNSAMRILAAGGQGITDVGKAIIGQESLITEEEIYKSVPINGEDSWLKSMSKDVVREAIRTGGYAGGVANMLMNAFGGGIPLAATQQMLQQTGKETSSDIPEAMAQGLSDPAMMMLLHQVHAMPVHDIVAKPPLPPEILRAIDNGILEPSDPEMKTEAMQHANAQAIAMQAEQERLAEPVAPREPAAPQTAHDIARQENPQLFGQYDALVPRRDFYTGIFNNLLEKRRTDAEANAPHNDEIAELQAKMEDANPRKTKIYQEKIDALKDKNQDYVDEQMQPTNFDEDLKNTRQKLADVSERLGHMEKDVQNALSSAAEKVPNVEEPMPAETPSTEPQPIAPPFEEKATPIAETPPAVTDKIADTISKQLQDVGRPKEEADAGAQVAASFYKTLADTYGGKHGTAEDWFAREGATVKAGGEGKSIRGAYKPATDTAKAVIRLMKSSNASTFIHETGHHFLTVMDRYARQEDTPQALKDDYAAVHKWLGLKDDADLFAKNEKGRFTYEKQQEQFAKGFENYLREGTAPTRALAGVFAKFKTWLTNIYKAAQKLNTPINADIRGVFDRLLSSNPERTTIAPERENGTMGGVHAQEAATTPPDKAAEARDKVRSEVDDALKNHNQEIYDAVKNAEADAGTAEVQAEAKGGAADSGTSPAGAEGPNGPATEVSGGGGEPSAKSSGVRAEPAAGGEGAEPVKKKNFPAEKLRDEAGNIRLENLTNDENIRASLRMMAQKLAPALNHDSVSDLEVAEFSRALGRKGDTAIIEKLRGLAAEDGVPLAAYVRAAREHLAQADDEARAFADKVENGTDADLQQFMESKDRFMMLASTVSETANELGRALRAFQDITAAKSASASELEELFQRVGSSKGEMKNLAKLVASKSTPGLRGQSAKVMQDAAKPDFWSTFSEYRRCSVLSGWVTHSMWLAGTGFNLGYKALVLDTLGGLHNKVGMMMMMGRADTGSEIFGGMKGLVNAIERAPNIISATGTAARTGKTVLRPFEGQNDVFLATGGIKKVVNVDPVALRKAVDDSFNENDHDDLKALREKLDKATTQGDTTRAQLLQDTLDRKTDKRKADLAQTIAAEMQNKVKTWAQVGSELHDYATSILGSIETVGKNMVSPEFYKDKPVVGFDRAEGAVPNISVKGVPVLPIGSVMRGSSNRIYSTMHTFTREISANIETIQEARRMAVEGLSDDEKKLPEAARDALVDQRRAQLMASPTKDLMQRVNKIANKQTLMSNESSFAKVITNLRNKLDAWSGMKLGSILMPVVGVPAEATAQAVVDNSLFGLASKNKRAALMGELGPLEQERAQTKMIAGTALLGLGFWLGEKGLATPSPSTQYQQEQERRDAGKQSGSIRLGDWMVSLAHVPVTGTVLTLGADLNHILGVAQGTDASDRMKPAVTSAVDNFFLHENALVEMSGLIDVMRLKDDPMNWLKNQSTSLIPQFISQTNNLMDPLQRESKSFMSSALSKIPFESQGLDPKVNPLNGEPLAREPFHVNTAIPDPVAQNLMSLHIYPANPKASINGIDLTAHQNAELATAKGHILYSGLQMLMLGDGKQDYDEADVNGKRKMIQRIQKHASDCAKSMMFNKYPELLKDANDQYEQECREDVQ